MKIEQPGSVRPSGVKKADKSRQASGSGFAEALEGAQHKEPFAQVQSVSPVDALFAVQEVGSFAREKPEQRGRALLDKLDELRHGLLTGSLSVAQLRDLAAHVASERQKVANPGLAEVLDEIDLRARVELAKYDRGAV